MTPQPETVDRLIQCVEAEVLAAELAAEEKQAAFRLAVHDRDALRRQLKRYRKELA